MRQYVTFLQRATTARLLFNFLIVNEQVLPKSLRKLHKLIIHRRLFNRLFFCLLETALQLFLFANILFNALN